MSDKKYKTVDGTEVPLYQMINLEPEWACNRIRVCEELESENAALEQAFYGKQKECTENNMTKEINSLHVDTAQTSFYVGSYPPTGGEFTISKIEESTENGQTAKVPVYLVYLDGGKLFQKIPSSMCRVEYKI